MLFITFTRFILKTCNYSLEVVNVRSKKKKHIYICSIQSYLTNNITFLFQAKTFISQKRSQQHHNPKRNSFLICFSSNMSCSIKMHDWFLIDSCHVCNKLRLGEKYSPSLTAANVSKKKAMELFFLHQTAKVSQQCIFLKKSLFLFFFYPIAIALGLKL